MAPSSSAAGDPGLSDQEDLFANGNIVSNAQLLLSKLRTVPQHWPNWKLRTIFTTLLIILFMVLIYLGPIAMLVTILACTTKGFAEIIRIGFATNRIPNGKLFHSVPWYFLAVANYFFLGETVRKHFAVYVDKHLVLKALVDYHRFFAFCLYFFGFIWFIFALARKYDVKQFAILTWTHLAIILIVAQSYLVVKNIFEGIIWLVVPGSMIACNDMMAYIFGKWLGKTPLTELSPKKTWEGFIGGGIFSAVFGIILAAILCRYPYFVCPVQYVDVNGTVQLLTNCTPSAPFQLETYQFSFALPNTFAVETTIKTYPFIIHTFYLSLFSSIIAPFGGIFASGFKRAFKVKDFGAAIPGHGGLVDRFDCQLVMVTFVNVYISSFIKTVTPEGIFSKVMSLSEDQQLQFYHGLKQLLDVNNATHADVYEYYMF